MGAATTTATTLQVRLIDPDGYTANLAMRVPVSDLVATVEAMRASAGAHAQTWPMYHPADYLVRIANETDANALPVTLPGVWQPTPLPVFPAV